MNSRVQIWLLTSTCPSIELLVWCKGQVAAMLRAMSASLCYTAGTDPRCMGTLIFQVYNICISSTPLTSLLWAVAIAFKNDYNILYTLHNSLPCWLCHCCILLLASIVWQSLLWQLLHWCAGGLSIIVYHTVRHFDVMQCHFALQGIFIILIIGSGIAQYLRLDWNIHSKNNLFTCCSDKLCGMDYKYITVMYRLCYVRGVCVCVRAHVCVWDSLFTWRWQHDWVE